MGNAQPTPASEGDVEGHVSSLLRDDEYQQSLRRYELTTLHLHHQLSSKKPPPAAEPKRSRLEQWSVQQLCDFVENGFHGRYGTAFSTVPEVLGNLRTHLIDGSTVGQLQAEDWRQLCPYIGPRLWLTQRLKEAAESDAHPMVVPQGPAPPPPVPSGAQQGAFNGRKEEVLDMQSGTTSVARVEPPNPAVPDATDVLHFLNGNPHARSAPHAASKRAYKATVAAVRISRSQEVVPVSDDSQVPAPPSGSQHPAPTGARPAAEEEEEEEKKDETPTLWQLVFGRSRFSNHRLIDTPWRPSRHTSPLLRAWQFALHKLLRLLFLLFTAVRVGLEPTSIAFLAVPAACTAVCRAKGWLYDFSPAIFVTVVVFPLTFSVNAAYNRREQALQILAQIKAAALVVYLNARSWPGTQPKLPAQYGITTSDMLRGLFRSYGHYLTAANETHRATILDNTYQQYLDLCLHVDLLRLCDLPPPLVGQSLSNVALMMQSFEKLRVFCDYRTPCTLRSFFWSCVVVLSFLMGPYCALLGSKYGYVYGYLVNLTFFWLLLCLNSIQRILENPFSTHGEDSADEDDINLLTLRGGHADSTDS
eukprot:GGOE01020573.1.p1 GENE.GGOE01020573.1~~GGOE01020573.1.p1  ORF type:complete len:619 (+),score=181.28 GGOE01020573.1:94-1857(+)